MLAEGSETLGQVLCRARGARGLSVQQIAAATRIPIRNLEALERNDLPAVPGGAFYLRAEVLAYAEVVGLSRDVALGLLNAALAPPATKSVAPAVVVSQPPRRTIRSVTLILGLCLVSAAIVMWRSQRDSRSIATSTSQPIATRTIDSLPHTRDATESIELSGTTGSVEPPDATAPEERPASSIEPNLEIISEPPGANVTVDGVGWGVTPVTIRYLPPGQKQVRVTRAGFAAEERLVRVAPDKPLTTVRIELRHVE